LHLRTRAGEIGHQREADPAVVGRILPERQPAVDLRVRGDRITRVLIGHAAHALLVGLAVSRCPPVAEIALAVVLTSLIVEAVRQLVSYDGASTAVVHGRIASGAVERRLEDAGGGGAA